MCLQYVSLYSYGCRQSTQGCRELLIAKTQPRGRICHRFLGRRHLAPKVARSEGDPSCASSTSCLSFSMLKSLSLPPVALAERTRSEHFRVHDLSHGERIGILARRRRHNAQGWQVYCSKGITFRRQLNSTVATLHCATISHGAVYLNEPLC
jgi:hypothetical protein